MTTLPLAAPRPVRGVLLYCAALLMFACLDGTTKVLTAHYPVPVVAAVRYASQLLLMTALLPRPRRALFVTHRPVLVAARSLSLVLVTLMMGYALSRLPLAEATSIVFLAPMLLALLAGPVLGERLSLSRWLAVIGGFLGVLLIVRPGGALDTLGVLFALLAAVFNSVYQLLSRLLIGERTVSLLYQSAVAGTLVFGLVAPFVLGGPVLTVATAALMFSLGVSGGLGHLFFTLAFREAPTSLLAPLSYLQLLWAALIGLLVFGQVPDAVSLLGMLVIAVSGVSVVLRAPARRPAADA